MGIFQVFRSDKRFCGNGNFKTVNIYIKPPVMQKHKRLRSAKYFFRVDRGVHASGFPTTEIVNVSL